jgi:hypothetical protein
LGRSVSSPDFVVNKYSNEQIGGAFMKDDRLFMTDRLLSEPAIPYSMVDKVYHMCADNLRTYKHLTSIDIACKIFELTESILALNTADPAEPAERQQFAKEINCLAFELASRQFKSA